MKEQEFIEYCDRFNRLVNDAIHQFIDGCNIEEISEDDLSSVMQSVLSMNHLSHFAHFYVNDMSDIEPYGEFVKGELERMHLECEHDPDRIVGRA